MKKQIMYGYPLSSIIIRIIGLIIISLTIFFIASTISPTIAILSSILLPVMFYFFIIQFRIQFDKKRKHIITEMINKADLRGDETILDIGTGSGYVAIQFAKQLPTGSVTGIDKYDLRTNGLLHWFFEELKINFFGNTLQNAKQNAIMENVEHSINFIKGNLTEPFPFQTQTFDIIVSSQFLYCIPHHTLPVVLEEINRILTNNGRLIFFESCKYMKWDIQHIKQYYDEKGYTTSIHSLEFFQNKCLLVAKK